MPVRAVVISDCYFGLSICRWPFSSNWPDCNIAAMTGIGGGAAWLVARSGHRVAAVAADSVLLVAATGSMLRIFKSEPAKGAVLAWKITASLAGSVEHSPV